MKKSIAFFLSAIIALSCPFSAFAHPGRTDGAGGHPDYKNVSGLGYYHYHHGYPAHLHPNGVCPYRDGNVIYSSSSNSSASTSNSTSATDSASASTATATTDTEVFAPFESSLGKWELNADTTKYTFRNSDGSLATGWKWIAESWYYFDGNGYMLCGKWLEYKGEWYYLKKNGTMAKDWVQLEGDWYYLGSDGIMRTGWQDIGGSTYYMSTSKGYCATGWCKIDGLTYYFDTESCKMQRDCYINGYYVDSDGVYQPYM